MKKINIKSRKFRIGAYITAFTAFILAVLWLFQLLLMPKYMTETKEGALISEYYNETEDHSVMFIGDCEVYENFSPITLWEQYGITSYIRGSAQQLIWQSYYLMEETLKYEKPEAIVFNVLSMKYGEPQKEAYNRMTLDGMKMSSEKLKSVEASMCEDESMMSYIFPLLRFHSRISDLSAEDMKYMFSRDTVSHNGYLMQTGVKPLTSMPYKVPLPDYDFADICWEYLDKMVQLCENNGVELILIKSPTVYPIWYDEWDAQIVKYAKDKGLSYYNFINLADEAGIDYTTDTYDAGQHLNVWGAEKLASYFGKILSEEHGVTDSRGDAEISSLWKTKCDAYYAEKASKTSQG